MPRGRDLLPRGRTTYGTPRAGRERFACVRLFFCMREVLSIDAGCLAVLVEGR